MRKKQNKVLTLPQFVLRARKELGLTQTELATELKFKHYTTVLSYEKGKFPVPHWVVDQLNRMLTAAGKSIPGATYGGKA